MFFILPLLPSCSDPLLLSLSSATFLQLSSSTARPEASLACLPYTSPISPSRFQPISDHPAVASHSGVTSRPDVHEHQGRLSVRRICVLRVDCGLLSLHGCMSPVSVRQMRSSFGKAERSSCPSATTSRPCNSDRRSSARVRRRMASPLTESFHLARSSMRCLIMVLKSEWEQSCPFSSTSLVVVG